MDFLEKLIAGYKLTIKIPAKAPSNQHIIVRIVNEDTTGLLVNINIVIIVPTEVPTAKLASKIVRL